MVGHEGLGEVLEAPAGAGFEPGDLVVGTLRGPPGGLSPEAESCA